MEELDAAREVVQREPGGGLEQDPGRQRRADEHRQRAEIGEGEPDREAAHAGQREAALEPGEEDALGDRRRRVGVRDQVAGGVDLEDAPDQGGIELAAEDVPLHLDADRAEADDRELAGEQLADVDLDPLDRAGERRARRSPGSP